MECFAQNKNFKQLNMKQITCIVLLFALTFFTTKSQAQDASGNEFRTIVSSNRSNGGYGALSMHYSKIDGKDAISVGARGAWIIDHSFAIGLGGQAFVNGIENLHYYNRPSENDLAGGYGGLILEPILAPRFPVHISFPVLLGVGAVATIDDYDHWGEWDVNDDDGDLFLVFEPSVELEFNMTRFMRMAASLSYRFTSDIELPTVKPDVMKGPSIGLVMKFGKF